jgi:hypothetical protein
MGYVDPDGAAHEVILRRPGFAIFDMRERAVWTTVSLGWQRLRRGRPAVIARCS